MTGERPHLADVAGVLDAWRRMEARSEHLALGNALPIMDLFDRYERGFIDRHRLAHRDGEAVMMATARGFMRGRRFAREEREGDR